MKIITIYEENHGLIGCATSMRAAFQYLISAKWITFEFPVETVNHKWISLEEAFIALNIERTPETLLQWCLDNAEDYDVWEGAFYFSEDELYEEEI